MRHGYGRRPAAFAEAPMRLVVVSSPVSVGISAPPFRSTELTPGPIVSQDRWDRQFLHENCSTIQQA